MFACFYVPDFPVQAALLIELPQARNVFKQSPLAILDGPANLPRVFALNPPARQAGIESGMTKLQVETYGGVLLRKRIVSLEDSAQSTLMEFAGGFSPRVESTAAGTVTLDLSGSEKLLGPWPRVAHHIMSSAAKAGFDLHIAIASNPDAAFHAARVFPSITIIAPGEEALRLAPLPVRILPASPQTLEILEGWGIPTFDALAVLPTVAIAERLGQEGLYLQKLARGETSRPLLTMEPVKEFVASFEFEDPVETLESLFFILNRLLQQLCANLISGSFATNELRLTIGLEVRQLQTDGNKELYQHEWKLPIPTQDRHVLFGLIRLHLERTTFSAPIRELIVEVVPVKPRRVQGNLFLPPSPEPEKLEMTLERIRGVVGSNDEVGIACVGSPGLLDTYRPGSFTVHPFSSMDNTADSSPAARVVAFRVFRPALETSVKLNQQKPYYVQLWHRHLPVLAASGPWCTSGNWWNAFIWAREEWDVALKTAAGIGFYRIYRDRLRRQWFVEGVFD
jgi:protein ImuB